MPQRRFNDSESFEQMFFVSSARSDHLSNQSYQVRRTARRVTDALEELGVTVRPLELPSSMQLKYMRSELNRRIGLYYAARLGIEVNGDERRHIVEEKTLAALPEILSVKGLIEGAIIHKNFGGNPQLAHRVVDTSHAIHDEVTIEDLHGDFGIYNYRATHLAVFATVVELPNAYPA